MTRTPAVAGMFYPSERNELKSMVEDFLNEAKQVTHAKLKGKLKALIVPHAGYIYSGIVAAEGYSLLKEHKFKKVVALGPSHYVGFYGAAIATENFSTPLGIVKCGEVKEWLEGNLILDLPEAHAKEHSLEVQLPFLQETLKDFELYAIVLGSVDEKELAEHISKFIDDKTLIVASSDLSHFLPYNNAVIKDNETIAKILKFNYSGLDACGEGPIKVLMHIAKKFNWKPHFIDYRNSGDTAGDNSSVVGYTAIAYTEG